MITIPRYIHKVKDIPSISLDGLTFVQYRRQESEMRHEICVSQHSLVFVLSGTKYIHSAEGDIVIKSGEAFFTRKGCHLMSEMIPDEGGAFDTILFFFDDSMFSDFIESLAGRHETDSSDKAVFRIKVSEPINIFLSSVVQLFDSSLGSDNNFLRLKVRELLHYLCSTEGNENFIDFLLSCRSEGQSDISVVMEQYFNKNINLEDFADLSGRSLSTFKREFKRKFDTTPAKWLRERRLSWSAQLILNSNKNITEIAYESGYDSLSHFSSIFRKHYGLTPREYRSGLKSSKSDR